MVFETKLTQKSHFGLCSLKRLLRRPKPTALSSATKMAHGQSHILLSPLTIIFISLMPLGCHFIQSFLFQYITASKIKYNREVFAQRWATNTTARIFRYDDRSAESDIRDAEL